MRTTSRVLRAAVLCAAVLESVAAGAQSYPVKPIHITVPFPPGGGSDLFARALAQKLTEAWGQQVVVDNRSGAAGMIGSDQVARAAPDGYTLLLTSSSSHAINPHLMRKPLYDPLRDFAPVILITAAPQVLVVHPSVPVKSVKELITLAKARPWASVANSLSLAIY